MMCRTTTGTRSIFGDSAKQQVPARDGRKAEKAVGDKAVKEFPTCELADTAGPECGRLTEGMRESDSRLRDWRSAQDEEEEAGSAGDEETWRDVDAPIPNGTSHVFNGKEDVVVWDKPPKPTPLPA
eukprot:GHVT01102728.1.p6 GENE.GHVT01102728.1~~GHVT01102728.1.p6  ORF type:complete len:126 (+),score=24.73 GHVT01102728.1:1400-1777(+)